MTSHHPATRWNARLPHGLAGLAAVACLACCAVPALIAAGILAGTGWATTGRWLPAVDGGLLIAAVGHLVSHPAPRMPRQHGLPRRRVRLPQLTPAGRAEFLG